jgi:alkylation response protein AidB-like acyl-CoA dehydrogenase
MGDRDQDGGHQTGISSMYNLHLGPEQIEIRETVRDFVQQEIKPLALKPERLEALDRSLPLAILDEASQLGLRTLALSEEAGGAGADALTSCIVAEELAAGDPDIAAVLSETSHLGHVLFDRMMTAEQRDRFLPPFLEDDRYHLALAHQEPDSDAALGIDYHREVARPGALKTTAVRTSNGEWIVNGLKDCVANAPVAKLFAVTATDPQLPGDVRTILVPRDAPGLTVVTHEGHDCWFHGACGTVTFQECRVPAQYLLDPQRQAAMTGGRPPPLAAAIALGIGCAAYEAALEYAGLRVQGGRRIVEHQAIGTKLAEIAIRLSVARNAVWQAAWASDHPEAYADRSLDDLPLATIATVFTAEAVYRAAKDAAECFGAMGVMRDMPLQKYVRDALISLHAGAGVSDAKLAIAEALAGYRQLPATSMRAAE